MLKWDRNVVQPLLEAQQELFVLKGDVPFSTNTSKSKFIQKLLFINSPLCVKGMVLELAKLQKTTKDAKTSAQVSFKKFFSDSDYNRSLIYHNLLPISFCLVRNDLLMLNKIYNCDTALKFDDYWKVFKGLCSNRSAAKQFLRTNFSWTKSVKLEEYFVLRVVKYANVLTQQNNISTFDWTCPTVLFRKQLNSLLKLKAVNFKYYQCPVKWSCFVINCSLCC